ncbi:MAG: sugar-binding protein [Verrucomicrobiota bacterium]
MHVLIGLSSGGDFPLNLIPGKNYSFSVYAKADHKDASVTLSHCWSLSKAFQVGTEWERLVFTFTPKAPGNALIISVKPGARVWLDAVQIEEGDATLFSAGAKTFDPRCRPVAATGSPLIPADTLRCPVTVVAKAPVLDGQFDDECWQDAPSYVIDSPKDGKKAATEFKLVSDGQFFYLAVTCHEPDMKKIVAKQTEPGSQVYTDDSIEIFLKSNLRGVRFDHHMVNSLGTKAQEVCGGAGWGAGPWWDAKTRKGDGCWNAEIQLYVPFNSGSGMPLDAPYLFNLCRSRVSANEYLPWHGLYNRPDTFAALTGLIRPGPLLQETGFDYARGCLPDQLEIRYQVRNISGKPLAVEPSLSVNLEGKAIHVPGEKVTLAADSSKELVFTLPAVKKTDMLGVQLQANQRKYRSAEVNLDPSDLIKGPLLQYNVYAPEDKVATFKLDLSRMGGLLKEGSLALSVKDGFGKLLWEGVVPMAKFVRGDLPLAGLAPGNLVFEANAVSIGKTSAMAKFPFRLVNPGGEVELLRADRFRRVMVCGSKPLSGLCGAYIFALTPSEAIMDDFKTRGAKILYVQATPSGASTPLTTPEQLRSVLDSAGRRGFKCVVGLSISRTPVMESEPLLQIQELVRSLKNHPALLAYDLTDEAISEQVSKMSAIVPLLQQLDPGHPMTLNINHVQTKIRTWAPYQNGFTLVDNYDTANAVYYTLKDARRCIPWNALYFWICSYNEGVGTREPSPLEFLAGSYAGIVNGASIIAPFTYKPASLDLWDAWKTLADEMETLKDALATEDFIDFGDDDGKVGASLRRTGSGTYVIAVTLSDKPETVHLALPGLTGKNTVAKVLFEQREVAVKDGVITDVFAPTARHVYLIAP